MCGGEGGGLGFECVEEVAVNWGWGLSLGLEFGWDLRVVGWMGGFFEHGSHGLLRITRGGRMWLVFL
jgi:hypothetical protein